MGKKHHDVRVFMHRAFAVFLTVFLISDVGRVYASRNLEIIAQQNESSQADAMRAEALKLMEEGLRLFEQGSKESLVAAKNKNEKKLAIAKSQPKKLTFLVTQYIPIPKTKELKVNPKIKVSNLN